MSADAGAREAIAVRSEAGIAWITLNRPEVRNALDADALVRLGAALERAERDPEVRAVILTGAGERAFSAGADIAVLAAASAPEVGALAHLAVRVSLQLEGLEKPVIAALNGDALGGGLELAEACMLRVAADHARLGHPEVRIGAVAGWGGTSRLARLVGRGRAADLLLTGRPIDAAEALAIGLVQRVVPGARLREEAAALARELAARSPAALGLTWRALLRGLDLPLAEALAIGADAFGLAAETEDFREGTRAFLEKRAPRFHGP